MHEVGDRHYLLFGVRPVGDRSKPRRLDEAKHVRRHCYAHVVTSAQQFTADGCAGLNVAATSVPDQHNSHARKPIRSAASAKAPHTGSTFQEIGDAAGTVQSSL